MSQLSSPCLAYRVAAGISSALVGPASHLRMARVSYRGFQMSLPRPECTTPGSRTLSAGSIAGVFETGQELGLGEADEAFLIWADLMEVNVVVARLYELQDPVDVPFGIGTADDASCDRILVGPVRCIFEVRRQR